MSEFFHGVRTRQLPTSLVPPVRAAAALNMVFGTAPIHRLPEDDRELVTPGNVSLLYSLREAGEQMGIDVTRDDFDKWTLSQAAYTNLMLFGSAPVMFVNVFNPELHFNEVTSEEVELFNRKGMLKNTDVFDDLELSPSSGGSAFVKGVDYDVNLITGAITAIETGAMWNASTVIAAYKYAAPDMVDAADVIGGYDILTGVTTGLELVNQAFPRFRLIPGILTAPKFSEDPTVAMLMAMKCREINGVFNAVAYADIPTDGSNGVGKYADVPAYKNENNLVSEDLYLCWPKVRYGDRVLSMSQQAAALTAVVDSRNGAIPYASPSNYNLMCTAPVADGKNVWLDLVQANYLNANGITTALNFNDGWKLWGNRTAAFPGNSDPMLVFISSRRMVAWYGNGIVLTWFQKTDRPRNRRLMHTIQNSERINLDALTAADALLGGSIEFRDEDNSVLDLMSGIITFHVGLGLVEPAEQINFNLEYDPQYLQTLFG